MGSTTLVTNESGQVVEEVTYEPFGDVSFSSGARDKFLYNAKEADLTGLYYYGARYYDPKFQRFTQADTILPNVYDPQQLNRYSYVRNNPYKYIDPNGQNLIVVNEPLGFGITVASALGHTFALIGNENSGYTRIEVSGKAGLMHAGIHITPQIDGEGNTKSFEQITTDEDFSKYRILVYVTDEMTDDKMLAEAEKIKRKNPMYLPGIYFDCDTFIRNVAKAGNVGYHRMSSIPNINYYVNKEHQEIIQKMRETKSSKPLYGTEGRSGYWYDEKVYVTEDGRIYPSSDPYWKPNPNAEHYQDDKSASSKK